MLDIKELKTQRLNSKSGNYSIKGSRSWKDKNLGVEKFWTKIQDLTSDRKEAKKAKHNSQKNMDDRFKTKESEE